MKIVISKSVGQVMKDLKIGLYLHRLKEKLDVKDIKSPLHRASCTYKHLKVMPKARNTNSYVQLWQYSQRPNQLRNLQHLTLIWVLLRSNTSSSSGCHITQNTLELTVTKSPTLSAEIQWASQSILKGHSHNSSNNISPLFKVVFPESKIVESFALGADKLRYLITYGIAPYFYDLLQDNVNNSDCYTFILDHSLNRIP